MPALPLLLDIVAVLLGLVFGSFLNVCISRLPEHRSVVGGRSMCPVCSATIRWYDNIPLLSFALLRCRCRSCGVRISWRYPLVELGTALWSLFCAHRCLVALRHADALRVENASLVSGFLATQILLLLGTLILGFLLIGLLFMDWETQTLPDAFTFTGIGIGFVLTCMQAIFLAPGQDDVVWENAPKLNAAGAGQNQGNVFLTGPEADVLGRLLAIALAALLPWLIARLYRAVRHREGLGAGDIKLMAMIAAFLGFWPAILAGFVGIVSCSAFALALLARKRADAATRLPLGSFLCAGGLLAAIAAQPIVQWYSSLLR